MSLSPRVCLLLIAGLLAFATASAHPEDEFCSGGDGLDPELCAALADLDSAEGELAPSPARPIPGDAGPERGFWRTFSLYISIGVRHIVPDGADHILFVLAIFLASVRIKALVVQISAFTVAHTATLALAATGVITPSPAVVESVIAFTIAFVAIENLVFPEVTSWRPFVVFGFGLVHGLGFAGFFGELGLPTRQFWSALIGFNLGVEIGQLLVIITAAACGALLRRWLQDAAGQRRYRRAVALPASLTIGLTGLWWGITRIPWGQ